MDIDLRKLRYFVAVAEELHFGRAAERLHITQPVLSRQIRALEHEIRAQLFSRDKRSTELTSAGRRLEDARPLLASAEALHRRVERAARGTATFTVGFMPGITVTAAVRTFAARHPELSVEVVRTSWDDQTEVVHDGRADISYVRMPVDQRGLRLRALFSEPRVAVLSTDHRLAGKQSIGIAELAASACSRTPTRFPNGVIFPSDRVRSAPGRGPPSTPSRRSSNTSRRPAASSSCHCRSPPSTSGPTSPTFPSRTSAPTRSASPGAPTGAHRSSASSPPSPPGQV